MADTADRRAEGQLSNDPKNVYSRDRYNRFRAIGRCVSCGKNEVKNRAWCYACSDRQSTATYRSGLRSFLQLVTGDKRPDPNNYTKAELAEIATALMEQAR